MVFQNNRVAAEDAQLTQSQFIANSKPSIYKGTCRICLQQDSNLIKPCECNGSMQMVHEKCIRNWIQVKYNKLLTTQIQCQICLQNIKYYFTYYHVWNPSKCSQNLQKINPCLTGLLLTFLFGIVILSIMLQFGSNDLLTGRGKIIVISLLTITTFGFTLVILIIIGLLFTEKKFKIQQIYGRKKILNAYQDQKPTSSQSSIFSQNV